MDIGYSAVQSKNQASSSSSGSRTHGARNSASSRNSAISSISSKSNSQYDGPTVMDLTSRMEVEDGMEGLGPPHSSYSSFFSNINNCASEAGRDEEDPPSYISVAALPSTRPARAFCSVCGYTGQYTCTRCGCRFCSSKCLSSHRETRCLKFAY
jgi:HIT zinc finger